MNGWFNFYKITFLWQWVIKIKPCSCLIQNFIFLLLLYRLNLGKVDTYCGHFLIVSKVSKIERLYCVWLCVLLVFENSLGLKALPLISPVIMFERHNTVFCSSTFRHLCRWSSWSFSVLWVLSPFFFRILCFIFIELCQFWTVLVDIYLNIFISVRCSAAFSCLAHLLMEVYYQDKRTILSMPAVTWYR